MKKICLLITILVVILQLSAQDIYNPISNLTDADKENITKAKDFIDRGDRMMTTADNEYQKNKDLFTSDKKGKNKKAEAKTVPAKRNMISAGNYFIKGYEILYNLYTEKLNFITFEFQEDQQKAQQLKEDAEKLYTDGQNLIKSNIKFDDKALKNDVKFQKLSSSIKNGAEKQKDAILKLVEALQLYENQTAKKNDLANKDNTAWQNALMENSIAAYQRYIDDFPNGLHVAEANKKIEELEQKIRDAELKQNNPDLVYHIQIMADKTKWNTPDIKSKIYFTNEPIVEQFVNGWYKYWIGNFKTYDDAKKQLLVVKKQRRDAFVVATVNGQLVDIKQALNIQNNKGN